MLRLFRKSARKLFLVAAAVALLTAGASRAYAAVRILWSFEDGSFVGVSCGGSAGPTLVVYDAVLNQTFAFAANPDLCKTEGGEVLQ